MPCYPLWETNDIATARGGAGRVRRFLLSPMGNEQHCSLPGACFLLSPSFEEQTTRQLQPHEHKKHYSQPCLPSATLASPTENHPAIRHHPPCPRKNHRPAPPLRRIRPDPEIERQKHGAVSEDRPPLRQPPPIFETGSEGGRPEIQQPQAPTRPLAIPCGES